MRSSIFLLFLFCSAAPLLAQRLSARDAAAIRQVLAVQQDAWNRGDLEVFMQGYVQSDSLAFVGKNGPVFGWQATLERYRRSYPDRAAMGELRFEVIRLERLGRRSAYLIGSWHLTRSIGDAGGYFTLIFTKERSGWQIRCDHTS
ncbi:MAG: nuclear transport factor 2 family protein [Bacteroidia bacterium]|nr:nuclear transport factor 2 family protein [Bacteroidia bacterium]